MEIDVPGGAARSLLLRQGQHLGLEALGAGANCSLLLYAGSRRLERLCVPDTLKAQMSAVVRAPMVLMSDAGRALMTVVASSGSHDCLNGHSTDADVEALHGPGSYAQDGNAWRQSGRRLLLDELAVHDLGERDLHACVNLFSTVGTGTWELQKAPAGAHVQLRADLDVLVVLCTAPHVLDPVWAPAPVRLTVSEHGPDVELERDEARRAVLVSARGAA